MTRVFLKMFSIFKYAHAIKIWFHKPCKLESYWQSTWLGLVMSTSVWCIGFLCTRGSLNRL